jgi:hypothetical protein
MAAPLFLVALLGCNAFGITDSEEDENEVRVTVRALGANFLDASDNFRYEVNSDTEFEGIDSFSDIAVGDVVEIEWEAVSANVRRALEIEADGADDDDG